MAKIPINFKRVAAAFDEAAKWRHPCDSSSGSEYWPNSGTNLSGLVNSFIEKGDYGVVADHHTFAIDIDGTNINNKNVGNESDDNDTNWVFDNDDEDGDTKRKELLQKLLLECRKNSGENENENGVKQKIFDEIDVALKQFGGFNGGFNNGGVNDASRSSLKRNLMAYLRDKGFDAGLCKTRWERTGRIPAGSYEYVDVNVGKTRYIVEVHIAGEFEIVRPTKGYSALVEMIPSILIIEKAPLLKQMIRLITTAMKESLKQANMHVAPWRRNGYMQAKYFGPYKRTTNRGSSAKNHSENERAAEGLAKKRSMVGFQAEKMPRMVSYYCKDDDFGVSKVNGIRIGLLASVLQGR